MDLVLPYTPQPRQALMHRIKVRQILYGGAAGGGKSHAMRWDAIRFCLENPGLDAYLFRRTRVELEHTHIVKIGRELPKGLGHYNQSRNRWEFPNGANLNMCYAEHETDVENYNSVEFHWLGVDEAGQFTERMLGYLKTRMRLGSFKPREEYRGYLPRVIFSANPGGASHNYLRDTFMRVPAETVFCDPGMRDPRKPEDRGWTSIYIPAKIEDNAHLDADYGAAFGGLPEWQQKMLREGDWNIVGGAFFDCWDSRKHIIKPFEVPKHWTRFRSCDWGFATPFSIGWWAVSDGGPVLVNGVEVCYPRDSIIRYREWYGGKKNKGLRMAAKEVGRRGRQLETGEKVSYGVMDPSAWKADLGPSAAEHMAREKFAFKKADNQRVMGWQEMYARLKGGEAPMLYVFETCLSFIRTVPVLCSSEKDANDIEKGPEDHVADETRYACMSRPYLHEKPKLKRSITDPITFNDLHREHKRLLRAEKHRRIRI